MSGGAFDYQSYRMEEEAAAIQPMVASHLLLAAISHELEWGFSLDTCLACARLRAVAALERYFQEGARDPSAAIALARDVDQNMCPRCLKRRTERDAERRGREE